MNTGYGELYDANDRVLMKVAEDSLNPSIDRVNEIIGFAKEAGIEKVGIANCITFQKEAEQLEKLLIENGFTVTRANCKLGRMPNEEILPGYKGVSCNPAGQARVMKDAGTELNIVMGLCLGHDMIFNSKSKVLTTTLLVKDRMLNHNTLQKFKLLP
jgi:uncharacterized metal-binding protein